jgi:transcriptional regulator with XRE-family HTH domain
MPNPTPAEILALRTSAGLTQRAFAKLLQLSSGSRINEYEHGQRRMSRQLWRLANILVATQQHLNGE